MGQTINFFMDPNQIELGNDRKSDPFEISNFKPSFLYDFVDVNEISNSFYVLQSTIILSNIEKDLVFEKK